MRLNEWDKNKMKLRSPMAIVHPVHPSDDIWVLRATTEWYRQGKTEELRKKPVTVELCPPQIPEGQTWSSALRGLWLTVWAMARPAC